MRAIICVGVSASGKTTFAKAQAKTTGAIVSNRDDLRFSLTGCSGWKEYHFDKKIEKLITKLEYYLATAAAQSGKDFILSNTNLNPVYRQQWVDHLLSLGYEVEYKTFPVSFQEACRRDSARSNPVGEDVIAKQWESWVEYWKPEWDKSNLG